MAALTFGAVWRKPCSHRRSRGRGERRGAAGAKDARLLVCHKSSGLPRDGLAAHASSLSSGMRRLASRSRSSSLLLSFPQEQTMQAAARLQPRWATGGLCGAQSPQSSRIREKEPARRIFGLHGLFLKTRDRGASWRIPASNGGGSDSGIQF